MIQVTFGNYKTYDDLGLVLSSKTLGTPNVKTYYVKVDGSDGALDYTDFFGGPHYENVKHILNFTITAENPLRAAAELKRRIHGRKMRIILDDEPGFYYYGRPYVGDMDNEGNIYTLAVTCECDPYRYKDNPTIVTYEVEGNLAIPLPNLQKKVVPTITASATLQYEFGEYTVQHTTGTFVIPELELQEGDNDVVVTGTGTVTFTYQEGGF